MSAIAAPPRLTPDDLLRLPDETAGYDLVNGRLEENPMSVQSNLLGGRFFNKICNWAEAGPGGDVFPQDSPFRCFPDDVDLVQVVLSQKDLNPSASDDARVLMALPPSTCRPLVLIWTRY